LPGRKAVGAVTIGGHRFDYSIWSGQVLGGDVLALDAETALVDLRRQVPDLALASASSGTEHCIVHPDDLGRFLLRHRGRHFAFHNCAFDFWVVARHLEVRGEAAALEAWWDAADEDRLHDTMILDQLIRLARHDAYPRQRNLGEVAAEYAGLEVDKADPYRMRYAEVIDVDWSAVDRGFFDYAIRDAIVTHAVYQVARTEAIGLMEKHGYDPTPRA
jgi:hypothetical protein